MHEVSQRWAVSMAVVAAIEGVLALILGAFFAPIPTHVDANQLVTSVFIRGFLGIIGLAVAFILAYVAGYRIQDAFEPTDPAAARPADTGSALLNLFTTPGPRRDALYAGGIVLGAYWFLTTVYIAALGQVGALASSWPSFITTHLLQGLAMALAGGGAGALGARNALTRRVTKRIFTTTPSTAALDAQQTSVSEPAPDASES